MCPVVHSVRRTPVTIPNEKGFRENYGWVPICMSFTKTSPTHVPTYVSPFLPSFFPPSLPPPLIPLAKGTSSTGSRKGRVEETVTLHWWKVRSGRAVQDKEVQGVRGTRGV